MRLYLENFGGFGFSIVQSTLAAAAAFVDNQGDTSVILSKIESLRTRK
jgi:hypothetical protein